MQIHSISSEELSQQAKFNSFILCQTKKIPLSEKLPFIVTTLKGKITKPSFNQESQEDFECNYSFDCINYIINGKRIILGEGAWIKPLLKSKEVSHLESYEIVNFESLELKNDLKFYFYHHKKMLFIQIVPKYLIVHDCLVFENLDHITETDFKFFNLANAERHGKSLEKQKHNNFDRQLYTFQSQYAIMSDIHFLGSFVRGFKSIGSYMKKSQQKEYIHVMDQILLGNLKRLYPSSNL